VGVSNIVQLYWELGIRGSETLRLADRKSNTRGEIKTKNQKSVKI
jgi:hypothetical protein